jgi:16S rRNA processing protein RimM
MSIDKLPDDAIEVGRVVDAWGVKGGLKLQSFSVTADGLLKVKHWFLQSPAGEVKAWMVESAKWHSDSITATLLNMTDRDVAQTLKGWRVWVSKSRLPKTVDGEYYWMDLLGCTALAADGLPLGAVIEVTESTVNAVLHVDCGGSYETALIPFVTAYVGEVNLTARTIQTQWEREWLEGVVPISEKTARVKRIPPV